MPPIVTAGSPSTGVIRVGNTLPVGQAPPRLEPHPTIPFGQTLAAGQSLPIPASGTKFYVFFANGPIVVKPDRGAANTYVQGTGEDMTNSGGFNLLTVSNPSATSVTFILEIGSNDFIDRRLVLTPSALNGQLPVTDAPTVMIPSGFTSINLGSSKDFPGNANGSTQRKQIIVQNLDASAVLTIRNNVDVVGLTILAGQSVSLFTSAFVRVTNATGSAISFNALEIYYAS